MFESDFPSGLHAANIIDELFGTPQKKYVCEKTKTGIVVRIDVPGVKPSDVLVERVGLQFEVTFKKKKHCFTIGKEFDPATARASVEYGVLELEVDRDPTSRETTRFKIDVKAK